MITISKILQLSNIILESNVLAMAFETIPLFSVEDFQILFFMIFLQSVRELPWLPVKNNRTDYDCVGINGLRMFESENEMIRTETWDLHKCNWNHGYICERLQESKMKIVFDILSLRGDTVSEDRAIETKCGSMCVMKSY